MNKKGLTLIELLAVLAIIAMLALLIFPIVTQYLNKTRNQIDDATRKSIIDSCEMYVEDNIGDTLFIDKNVENIKLITLVDDGILSDKIRDVLNKKNYDLEKSIITVSRTGNSPNYVYDYELNLK